MGEVKVGWIWNRTKRRVRQPGTVHLSSVTSKCADLDSKAIAVVHQQYDSCWTLVRQRRKTHPCHGLPETQF